MTGKCFLCLMLQWKDHEHWPRDYWQARSQTSLHIYINKHIFTYAIMNSRTPSWKLSLMFLICSLLLSKYSNVLDAAQTGAASMLSLVGNIVTVAFAFFSYISWINKTLEWFGDRVGIEGLSIEVSRGRGDWVMNAGRWGSCLLIKQKAT